MTEPILDLSTLAPVRQTIRIKSAKLAPEGTPATDDQGDVLSEDRLYEMRTPDELSLTDQQWFMNRADDLFRLGTENAETDEAVLLLEQALEKIMVDLPSEVAEQLPRPQRWKVVAVFLMPFVDALMPIVEAAEGTKFAKALPSLSTTGS